MDMQAVSRYHRFLHLGCAGFWTFGLLSVYLPIPAGAGTLAFWVFNIYCCHQFAQAIGKSPGAWALLGFVGAPFMCMPQLHLIDVGNKIFKGKGLKASVWGGLAG